MAIEYTHAVEGDILKIKASGYDENLQQAQAYGMGVLSLAMEHNCTKVICDEVELKYELNNVDTYLLAQTASQVVPALARIAIIYNPSQSGDIEFWETVTTNRGLQVRIFKDPAEAEAWIA